MRVATFNLLHGAPVQRDGGLAASWPGPDEGALREAVGALDADVLAVQEADVHQRRSGGCHQVDVAADVLGAPWWRFVAAVRGTPGPQRAWTAVPSDEHAGVDLAIRSGRDDGPTYGIGVVSRHPVRHWRSMTFPPARIGLPLLVSEAGRRRIVRVPDEPRVAVAALLQTPRGPLTVVATHLSFVPGVNARQLRTLQRWVAGMPRPLLLCGDLNLPGVVPSRLTGWEPLVRAPTYPSYRPTVQLDHVLADGLPVDVVAGCRATVHALGISDHCAVVVDIPW